MQQPSTRSEAASAPPLIAHVVFNLGIGGLENGLVNLINNTPREAYRHAVVCVRGMTDFHKRLRRDDVPIVVLGQKPGLDPGSYVRAWRVFSQLRPDIVHTRNLAALEMQLPAALARVPIRVHSEHGRDGLDLNGDYARYNRVRKLFRPLVHRYVAMSKNLQDWLVQTIAIDAGKVEQIYNGVDTVRFASRHEARRPIGPDGFTAADSFIVGAVGRMVPVKDHETLVRGFARLRGTAGASAVRLRLVFIGDGPCRTHCERVAAELGVASACWFAGDRDDVADMLRQIDVLCLTSLNEGINNTVLEAMATGLPVVATNVGGNPELVESGSTGTLVPVQAPAALADALQAYLNDAALCLRHGTLGRERVEKDFSIAAMVSRYASLYENLRAPNARKAEVLERC
jgi:sugar transferase (PEP-CTERM/EpsH1 system associated)